MTFSLRLAGVVFLSAGAWGQDAGSSFADLQSRVKAGDTLYVTDAAGVRVKGRLADLSGASLGLMYRGARREFAVRDIREVRLRERDGLWNGTLIGLGAGIGAGLLSIPVACGTNDRECGTIVGLVFVPIGAGIGAVAGALIDKMIARSATVYRGAVSLAQLAGRGRRGFALTIRF